jgi:NADPH2:quinone reductase
LQAQGKYQQKHDLPFVLGTEFAGRISQDSPIPDGCRMKRGQRVFGAQLGAFSDKVAVNYDQILHLPDTISFEQGAGTWGGWLRLSNYSVDSQLVFFYFQGFMLLGLLVMKD